MLITLDGHPEPYRLDEAAYARLSGYLDRAARRLQADPDREEIVGVCTGIAAYTEIRIDWVRTVFVLATIFSGGLFLLVYIALAVLLPVVPTAPVRR